MTRPVAVRLGISLLLLALILNAAAVLSGAPRMSRLQGTPVSSGGAIAGLLFYAALLYAIAQRRNWARLLFAFLVVTGTILAIFFAALSRRMGEVSPPGLAFLLLIGAGVVCLFLPSASAWYHGGRNGSRSLGI
jgi:hypothetical protein